MEENKVPVAADTSEQQVQVANTDSQVDEEQQDPDIPEDQTSRASQDENYRTAINDDEQDDTTQFGNPVTQPFLPKSVSVPIKEVQVLHKCYKITYEPTHHLHTQMLIHKFNRWLNV